jgi:eukaryotic-like serine/threonine-protein kinase
MKRLKQGSSPAEDSAMTERDIFLALLDLPDPAARAAFLAKACAGDAGLRERVESLLHSHENAGGFLSKPALPLAEPRDTTLTLNVQSTADKGGAADVNDLSFLAASTLRGSLGRLGHYEILEVLGRGGFGIVFRAFDESLQRVVAIKVLAPVMALTSPARKRFVREAQSYARINHENVVRVYAVEEQPLPYVVLEFVSGETLQQRLDRTGPLEAAEVVRLGRQIAEGLAAAHAKGLIHRDVKPANILIEAPSPPTPLPQGERGECGRVKITDFGLARAADDASLSQSGFIAGTPMYMAPEQASADALDHRADLFSLGSVLYAMCTGRPPFRAPTTLAVLKRVAEDTPRPIREIIPEAPQWLCDFIARLHAKKPEDRFASAHEAADLLEQHQAPFQRPGSPQTPPAAAPAAFEKKTPQEPIDAAPVLRRPRWHARRWAAAAAVLLLLLGGFGFTEVTGVTDFRGTVIRLFAPEGTLVIEVEDPGVSVKIDGSDMVITGAGVREIRVKPGRYVVEGIKDGKIVSQELVAVAKNGKRVVRVSQEMGTIAKAPENHDPDRRAAEYVLSSGGAVKVNARDEEIKALPREAFRLTGVVFWNADGNQASVTDAGLAVFKSCQDITEIKTYRTRLTDAGLANFKSCKDLTFLGLEGPEAVTDAGLAAFESCKNLKFLRLTGAPLTGAGLVHFKDCKNLASVQLYSTQVSDAGLIHIKSCKSLRDLSLLNTQVSDAGLAHLAELDALIDLDVRETKVTAKGVDGLAKALPKCKITWDGGVIEPRR